MELLNKWKIPLIAAALLCLPLFINSFYATRMMTTLGIYLIVAMGLNLLLGYTGLVSLGHAGLYGIAAYATGLLMKTVGMGFWPALVITLFIGMLVGLFIGIITLKLNHAYLAITTLGLSLMIQTVLLNWRSLTGGFEGLLRIPKPEIFGYVLKDQSVLLGMVILLDILVFLILRNLLRSKFGRSLKAVRDDPIAASMMGINVVNIRLMAFTISSVLAALAGSFYAGIYGGLFPDYFSMDLSILFLCMVVLGGMGTLAGPIVGAILISGGLELLKPLGVGQMLVYGILVVTVCMFKPGGVVEIFDSLRARFMSRSAKVRNTHA
jgi:branched-chain amino acid transport system permease protein